MEYMFCIPNGRVNKVACTICFELRIQRKNKELSQWNIYYYSIEINFFKVTTSDYSHLFNKRGAWNKRGVGAKVAKSLNVEFGINEEGGIFGKN